MSLALLAIGYYKSDPKATSSRVFALMVSCVILYVLSGMTESHVDPQFRLDLTRWGLLTGTALPAIPGLFMVYCFLVFQAPRGF